MRYRNNSSGRVLWTVIGGRLREEGPESFSFTMTATDTHILFGLLKDCEDEIERAYLEEQRTKQVVDIVETARREGQKATS